MIASAIRLGSIDKDFYVHAVDLARLLKTNEVEISRLVRSSVLTRVPDPNKSKAFLYPCLENVTRFVEFHRGKREAIHQEFLREKAGRERATRLKVEMFNRERAGELVDKANLIARVEPIIVAYREQMLSRADRIERELVSNQEPQGEGAKDSGSRPGCAWCAIRSVQSSWSNCKQWRERKNVLRIQHPIRLRKFSPDYRERACRRLLSIQSSG